MPRRIVLDSSFETRRVVKTEATITTRRSNAPGNDENLPLPVKNRVIIRIKVGNLPLQGTKLLVKAAMSRSLGESMIRVATTPAALQPKPMHMVRDCFPCEPALRKRPSRLKAMRGRKPQSSRRVKSGKKMAIGGSITATTHERVRKTP